VPSDNVNDRCELREAKLPFGTEVWYRFSIRVPNTFPERQLRFVAAQFKLPYDVSESGSPAFALRIDNRHWLATIENLYEPKDKMYGRYVTDPINGDCGLHAVPALDHHNFDQLRGDTQFQVRAVFAADAEGIPPHAKIMEFTMCTTGSEIHKHAALPPVDDKWTDIIFHFSPSGAKDIDGLFKLFVNEKLVAQAWGEFGYADKKVAQDQYFKIGPYRNNDPAWGPDEAAIEVRNVRRGSTAADVDLTPSWTSPHNAAEA
jgi:hypothetical protein